MHATSDAIAAAARLKANAHARVNVLADDEPEEKPMPRGVYDRTKAAKKPADPKPEAAPKKRGRPAKAKPEAQPSPTANAILTRKFRIVGEKQVGPRFGVFDDGSVTLSLPGCKGSIAPDEAREFLGFLAKIGVKA